MAVSAVIMMVAMIMIMTMTIRPLTQFNENKQIIVIDNVFISNN